MKAREQAQRLRRFAAEEYARKVADLEAMIREFDNIAADLERQVQTEEERTGVRDPAHFAYSTFAKAAAQRRDNLRASVADLQLKLEVATRARDEAMSNLGRDGGSEPVDRRPRNAERTPQVAMR